MGKIKLGSPPTTVGMGHLHPMGHPWEIHSCTGRVHQNDAIFPPFSTLQKKCGLPCFCVGEKKLAPRPLYVCVCVLSVVAIYLGYTHLSSSYTSVRTGERGGVLVGAFFFFVSRQT